MYVMICMTYWVARSGVGLKSVRIIVDVVQAMLATWRRKKLFDKLHP